MAAWYAGPLVGIVLFLEYLASSENPVLKIAILPSLIWLFVGVPKIMSWLRMIGEIDFFKKESPPVNAAAHQRLSQLDQRLASL